MFNDNFNHPDENLEASVNWTRIDGVVGAIQVIANEAHLVEPNFANASAYVSPDEGSPNHYTQILRTSGALGVYFDTAIRVLDANNFIGAVALSGLWLVMFRDTGAFNVIGSIGLGATHLPTDIVRLSAFGDKITFTVNGIEIGTSYSFIAFNNTVTRQGMISYQTSATPTVDNYETDSIVPETNDDNRSRGRVFLRTLDRR